MPEASPEAPKNTPDVPPVPEQSRERSVGIFNRMLKGLRDMVTPKEKTPQASAQVAQAPEQTALVGNDAITMDEVEQAPDKAA